jgi:hypothetical protein
MGIYLLATAIYYECDKFITNDKIINSITEIEPLLLDDWDMQ